MNDKYNGQTWDDRGGSAFSFYINFNFTDRGRCLGYGRCASRGESSLALGRGRPPTERAAALRVVLRRVE